MNGIWLGVSYILGRPVAADQPHPHTCGRTITGGVTGFVFRIWNRDCVACSVPAPAGRPCRGGCGYPLDPAAAAGGYDRHPGCEGRGPTARTQPWRHDNGRSAA